jgi:hypothetical protein
MKPTLAAALIVAPVALLTTACSDQTEENAQVMAERAAADAEANAEVIGNELREGAIVAADEVSEGAAELRTDLAEADAADPDPGDGELDGTD